MGDTLEQDVEEIKATLKDIMDTLTSVSILQEIDHVMTLEHDKILIRGNGVPSLQETVRALALSVTELLADSKITHTEHRQNAILTQQGCWDERQNINNLTTIVNDWVANVKEERDRRAKLETENLERRRLEMSRWKWTLIALGFTIIPAFAWQFIVFWVDVAPNLKHP